MVVKEHLTSLKKMDSIIVYL